MDDERKQHQVQTLLKPHQVDDRIRTKEILGTDDTSRAAIAYAHLAMNDVLTDTVQLTEMIYQLYEAESLESAFAVTTRSRGKQHLAEPVGRPMEPQGTANAVNQPESEGRHMEPHGDDGSVAQSREGSQIGRAHV